MLALSVINLGIFSRYVQDQHLELAIFKYKYANRKPIYGFRFDINGIVDPICHYFRDNHSRNIHDLGLETFRTGQGQM